MDEKKPLSSRGDDVTSLEPEATEVKTLIDYTITQLSPFNFYEIDDIFNKVNFQLYNRFDSVEKSKQFRDLPQGKLFSIPILYLKIKIYTKLRTMDNGDSSGTF